MKLQYCFLYTLSHIYNQKGLFFVSIIASFISFLLIDNTLMIEKICTYDVELLEDAVQVEFDELYKINSSYVNFNQEYSEAINQFMEETKSIDGFGMYYFSTLKFQELKENQAYLEWNQQQYFGTAYENYPQVSHVLNLEEDLLGLCQLTDIEGNKITLQQQGDYFPLIVGYHYKEIVPVGTILTDSETGEVYIVTQILIEGATWMSSNVLADGSPAIELDDYFITLPNDYYTTGNYSIAAFSYVNSMYYYCTQPDLKDMQLKKIQEAADETGVIVEIESFQQFIQDYKQEYNELYVLKRILTVIVGIVTLVSMIIISVITWMLQKHDIGVGYANGIINADVLKMIGIENIIRLFLPMAAVFNYQELFGISENLKPLHQQSFFWIVFLGMIVGAIATVISYEIIKKYTPVMLLKGETL